MGIQIDERIFFSFYSTICSFCLAGHFILGLADLIFCLGILFGYMVFFKVFYFKNFKYSQFYFFEKFIKFN